MTGEQIFHIIGLLNSKLITWYFRHCIGTTSGVGTNRWLKYTIEQIPIAPVDLRLKEMSKKICKEYDSKLNAEIDFCVCGLYLLDNEETKFIIGQ